MTRRAVLYGYTIQDGIYNTDPETAPIVQRVFDLYAQGESYNRIADTLNSDQVAYLPDRPLWNKHLIKRLLQNPKYIGNDIYPAIITSEQYQTIQELIADKTAARKPQKPTDDAPIWPLLICGACGGAMKRTGGGPPDKSNVCLRCKACGLAAKVPRRMLKHEILLQYNAYISNPPEKYVPSEEVVRLNNAVNRALENVEDSNTVISLILKCASARYSCFTLQRIMPEIHSLGEMDWKYFREIVSAIEISAEKNVSLVFYDHKQKEGR